LTEHPQWQALQKGGRIFGIFRLPGASQWRYVRENGERRVFSTEHEASEAARRVALDILFPRIVSTIDKADRTVAEALGVEEWLRSRRQDVKRAQTIYRPGKRPYVMQRGKVRA
jgi:hypothetical protein